MSTVFKTIIDVQSLHARLGNATLLVVDPRGAVATGTEPGNLTG